jgi:uncharacterized membrane protein
MTVAPAAAASHTAARVAPRGMVRSFWQGEPRFALGALSAIGLASFSWMLLVTWLRHRAWFSPSYDMAFFSQGLWLLGHLKAPFLTTRALNLFGDHATFSLVLLAPLARLWPGSNVSFLYSIQAFAVAVAVIPLYRLSRVAGAPPTLGLAACVAYVVNPFLQNSASEFHPEVLSIPLLLLAITAAWEERWVVFAVSAFLAALGKEDLVVVVAFMGLWLIMTRRSWRVGLATAIPALLVFAAEIRFVIPHFSGGTYLYTGRLAAFGHGILGVLVGLVVHFDKVVRAVFGSQGLPYLALIFASFGLLPLLEPALLIPAVPTLGVNLLSNFPAQRAVENHYLVPALPLLFASMAVALGRLHRALDRAPDRASARLVSGILVGIALVPSLSTNWIFSQSQPDRQGFRPVLERSDHSLLLGEAARLIPLDASVSASYYLSPHVAERFNVYVFPMPFDNPLAQVPPYRGDDQQRRINSVEYVFVDRNDAYYARYGLVGLFPNNPGETWDSLNRFYANWDHLYDRDGILVARRPRPAG